MGGGISSLPKSEQLKISNELRIEYENLVKEHPENEAQIQSKLMEKYHIHVNEKTTDNLTSPLIKSPHEGLRVTPMKKKGGRTRRKSFGQEDIKPITPEDAVPVVEDKDSWV
jgi:hypothetical protein